MNVSAIQCRGFLFFVFFTLFCILECIPREAEARRGRAFGRRIACQGPVRRVNRARGIAFRDVSGSVRGFRNNNDIFGLDLEPVNAFSSLALDPFGNLQRINGFGNIVTDGRGRFFVVDQGFNNSLVLQAELLRSGNSFFGAMNPFTGALNPSLSSEAFNQALFLNTLGTLGTSCRNGICSLR